MKMKHWAYIGMTLIEVNASLLGGARAAELTQNPLVYRQPAFTIFRYHLEAPWHKPVKLMAPVTVRLFSEQKVHSIWIKNTTGFVFSGQVLESPLRVEVKDGQLYVFHGQECQLTAPKLALSSMDDEAFEVTTRRGRSSRWTRGELRLRAAHDHLEVISQLDLEDYVSGILQGELGSLNLSPEVLKAQLIVARTYVLSMRGNRGHHGMIPRMVLPPLTGWPRRTFNSAVAGRIQSTRDPNRIKPIRSPTDTLAP